MDLVCYCNVSSNDERPGHISKISRTRACKHKNLVIHINTRTWGQVSRYECLYCSLDRLGRHRSFYAVSCTTRLSMLVVYVAEKLLNPWISDTKFIRIDYYQFGCICPHRSVYLYEEANHVRPEASLEESSCKSILWYFQLHLKYFMFTIM